MATYRGHGAAQSSANDMPRPDTPDSQLEGITPVSHAKPANPFATPYGSMPASRMGSTTQLQLPPQRYFHSRRVKPGTVEQPWKSKKDPMAKWITIIPILGILVGLGVSGVLIWEGLTTVINHEYCSVLEEDFSSGINTKIWTKEGEVGGFGNGEFEQTTTNDENVYIKDGELVIRPSLQDSKLIDTDGTIINLLEDGTCTSTKYTSCITGTNKTNGTIVNPVKSGRINTKAGAVIKYGRVEVVAKLPAGDWLWPAIWLLPVDNTYGDWPRSGEIDIIESRGNNYTYAQGGNNIVSSAIHWGPNQANDGWWRNNVKRSALHTTYSAGYHTFGLEWSEKYIFTYVDSRLLQVMYTKFEKPFWEYGQFPLSDSNGTRLSDPWSFTGRDSTPFDQDFYLILNIAVGGSNGWFKDGNSDKPWVDGSASARVDFWNARDQWYPTWGDEAQMNIKSVKMWQQKGYNNC